MNKIDLISIEKIEQITALNQADAAIPIEFPLTSFFSLKRNKLSS